MTVRSHMSVSTCATLASAPLTPPPSARFAAFSHTSPYAGAASEAAAATAVVSTEPKAGGATRSASAIAPAPPMSKSGLAGVEGARSTSPAIPVACVEGAVSTSLPNPPRPIAACGCEPVAGPVASGFGAVRPAAAGNEIANVVCNSKSVGHIAHARSSCREEGKVSEISSPYSAGS